MKKHITKWFHNESWRLPGAKRPLMVICLFICCLTCSNVYAQLTVTGSVRDTKGIPLPGVSIKVKGISGGVSTSVEGTYSIRVPQPEATLIFSFIGFHTHEEPLKGRNVINVELKESNSSLEEVVVVAFGTQKKTDVIGAVTSINPGELKVPSSNLTTSFAGRLSGVIAYQRSGEPGMDDASFFIRGVTTFGYKKEPLILIDGVELPVKELSRLQPDDIESFSIMKDATATSLYGARGANGVILVTTKQGKVGAAKISLRYENSVSAPTRDVELADPITFMKLGNEAVLTRDPLGITPYSESKIDNTIAGTNPYVFPAIDWRKELFKKNAINQRANFNVSGGGQIAQYYLAGTYNQDNGVLKVDNRNNFNNNIKLKSYALRSNVSINVTKSTKVGVRLYGTFDDYTGPLFGGADVYNKVMRSNPVMFPAFFPADEAHKHVKHIMFGGSTEGNYINPYADLMKGYKDYSKSLMLAQFELNQELSFITEGLSLRGMVNTNRESFFDLPRSYTPFQYQVGSYDKYANDYQFYVINPNGGTEYLNYDPNAGTKLVKANVYLESALNYNRTFNKKHGVSGLLVFNMRNFLEGNSNTLLKSLPYRNIGVSGRTTYSYDNRYFAEFNFGYNGSERFYEDRRFGFFPSAGIAWSVSNEKFWESLRSTVSKLRFRATYGLVGNDAIGSAEDRFFYLSTVDMNNSGRGASFGTNSSYRQNGILVSRYDNKLITWERAKKMNLGLELGLFNNVDLQVDYFTEYRDNILMSRAFIPTTMGLSAPVRANVGEAAGKGVDMSLDFSRHFGRDFWITTRGNFTYAKSEFKVVEEPDYKEKNLSRLGYSLSQRWGYIAERLFIDENDVANSPVQNFGLYSAGDIKYRDVNGDGQVTTLDRVPIGYPTDPEMIYGFGASTGYKNFDFSFFFQGSGNSSFWINEDASTTPFVDNRQLLSAYANSYWSEENRNIYALFPRLSTTVNTNNDQLSTWFMRNGSFLRLKSVELGFTFPKRLTQKIHVNNLRIYATGTNLATWSKFKIWDVEMGNNGLGYPIQKVYNMGIQMTF